MAWKELENCLDLNGLTKPTFTLGKGPGVSFSHHFQFPTICQNQGYKDETEPGPSGLVGKAPQG